MSTRVRNEGHNAEDDQGVFTNRSTMMANFEEWIKMATDNKINSRNSWNFALIDYFHDLQVLRDSENNINFQKASATLDGCVKIYSSRVDSVTTETGKLLSGLAQSKEKKNLDSQSGERGNEEPNESEDSLQIDAATGLPVSNDAEMQGRRRVLNRVLETTLVDFDQIKMKELDQELNIDPIFKKALVDFDEVGAKSFLLNTLSVDSSLRVVFDTAIRDTAEEELPIAASESEDQNPNESSVVEDEILALGMDFINFEQINSCELSASIPQLRGVVEDIDKAKTFIEGVNNKFDNFLSEKELQEAVPETNFDDIPAFDEDLGPPDAEDHQLEPVVSMTDTKVDVEQDNTGFDPVSEQELMAYFDETLKRNWRGREHWKVRSFKQHLGKESKSSVTNGQTPEDQAATDGSIAENPPLPTKKKTSEIDFFQLDDNLEEKIFSTNKRRTNIEMPQRLRTNDTHYLLPDDYHFSSDKITSLFIKPSQKMSLFKGKESREIASTSIAASGAITNGSADSTTMDGPGPTLADEKFWAENYERKEQQETTHDSDVMQGQLENPFDDCDGGVDFNQAFEGPEAPLPSTALPSTQDNKVNYARVSKKVDVRKLKDNLWSVINSLLAEEGSAQKPLSFAAVARELGTHYSEEARRDLSTSFCFICLLHLANEHGLQIKNSPSYDDLIIT